MRSIKTAQCKRCGSQSVAWHQSKKTGRWYLAFAVQCTSRSDGAVYPQTPHKCDDPLRGGRADFYDLNKPTTPEGNAS